MKECLHTWIKWGDPFETVVTRPVGSFGDTRQFYVVMQEKICPTCNRIESRTIRDGRLNSE